MIQELHHVGLSISDIARRTGRDRKTVRRIIGGPLLAEAKQRRRRSHKLDPFCAYLDKRINEGVFNARKLYAEIRARGYEGGESQVRVFVHPYRAERLPEATVRFETEPGEQAQVDWGSFGYIEEQGRRCHLYAFVMTMGWSRAMYVEFTTSADCAQFLRCHLHAFHYFGGVPQEVLHDNLKDAVLERDEAGEIHWNTRYLDFARYYGFSPRACRPYRAQTKGKVESGIKYVKGNFWPGLHYCGLADLNAQARLWLDTVANTRVHGTTNVVPFVRLPSENLSSIAAKPDYDTALITYARVSKDCLVSFAGNYYSVPAAYHGHRLELRASESGLLTVLNEEGQVIAEHTLCHGYKQRLVDPAHYQQLTARPQPQQPVAAVQVGATWPQPLVAAAPAVETRDLRCYEEALTGLRQEECE